MRNMVRTVSGLLYHGNEILLHKHKKLGVWMGPGGHIEPNEPETVALTREIYEETGLVVHWDTIQIDYDRVRYYRPDDIVEINIDANNDKILDYTFFKQVDETVRNTKLVAEVGPDDIGWFNIDWALENLPMFADTISQVKQIRFFMECRDWGF